MQGFVEPFKLGRYRSRGEVMIYIDNDIPSKFLTTNVFPIEKSKLLLLQMYHAPSQPDQYNFNNLDKSLGTYKNYENVLLVGGFNAQTIFNNQYLSSFFYHH